MDTMELILFVWNMILTVVVLVTVLLVTGAITKYPVIKIDKDGLWVGYRTIDGYGRMWRII